LREAAWGDRVSVMGVTDLTVVNTQGAANMHSIMHSDAVKTGVAA
jgi:hypothetical protein